MNKKKLDTQLIKEKSKELGFFACGISKVEKLIDEENHFSDWLKNGYHAKMEYMGNNIEKRLNPELLVENSKTVISVLLNYFPKEDLFSNNNFKISKYAYGNDYHEIVKEKLFSLFNFINTEITEVNGRAFVDSAPVLETSWAVKSGLGWIGKNTNLITKNGSFFFIGELIIDLELEYDLEYNKNYCGSCNKCVDACPTKALKKPYTLDANRCISYLTIENKENIPNEFKRKMDDWIFGCDICQDICPWNKFSISNTEPKFKPNDRLKSMSKDDWIKLDEETYKEIFKKSPVKRVKYSGLMRNINFLKDSL